MRPYPKPATDILDDKISLAQLLDQHKDISPRVIQMPQEANPSKLYFVKHRFGAQGKSVYVYRQLEEWWSRSKNPRDFVVQEEVVPALDEMERNFVLRAHILLFQRQNGPIQAFLHRNVVCMPHASSYHHESHDQTPNVAYISKEKKKNTQSQYCYRTSRVNTRLIIAGQQFDGALGSYFPWQTHPSQTRIQLIPFPNTLAIEPPLLLCSAQICWYQRIAAS